MRHYDWDLRVSQQLQDQSRLPHLDRRCACTALDPRHLQDTVPRNHEQKDLSKTHEEKCLIGERHQGDHEFTRSAAVQRLKGQVLA